MKLVKNTTVAILALWRDSEPYLDLTLKQFEELERTLRKENIHICYGFFENDSEDKTPALLQSWLKSRLGFLISERIRAPKWGSVPSTTRTKYQARYRNMALDLLRQHYNFDYLLVADTDVIWTPHLVTEMISQLESYPGLGMITPNTRQNVASFTEDLHSNSYFDSWALLDSVSNQGLTFADNPFLDPADRKQWTKGQIVSVSSAFGSIALVRGSVLDSGEVQWDGEKGCEHWYFCKRIRDQGYQVGVDPNLLAFVVHKEEVKPHPLVIEKEKTRLSIATTYSIHKEPDENPPISFGITTGFTDKEHLLNCVRSIRNQCIPQYEILIIGPEPPADIKKHLTEHHKDITFIPFDETKRPLWITKKKNTLAQQAKYKRLILLHDYLQLSPDWYRNFRSFELLFSWTVLAFPQRRADGGRFWYDWSGFEGPRANDQRVFFNYLDWSNNDKAYISGNIFAVHRDLLIAYPLDESLGHMDEEDLEWSNRLQSVVHFKCADNCLVLHQKDHRDLSYFQRVDKLHESTDLF